MKLENYKVRNIKRFPPEGFTGRQKIYTDIKNVTIDNVVDVLENTLAIHARNAAQIDYLWRVYRGEQDIRHKEKYTRDSINEKVCVNRAYQIVTFMSAFFLAEPIQYISHGTNSETLFELVNTLNEYMRMAGKEGHDKELVDWMHICGVGTRMALRPEPGDDAPFSLFTPDPRRAYVVYYSGIGEPPVAGVFLGADEKGKAQADVYTATEHFLIVGDKATRVSSPQYDGIPLVEYTLNKARLGAFEVVLPILNGINKLESSGIDAIEDFVNGFDVFQNCEIEDGKYAELALGGQAVMVKTTTPGMEAKVYRIASELNQSGLQSRIDDLTDAYIEICGLPNRNGGSSTSDTGAAVMLRDGWSEATSRAGDTETQYRKSEREFDKVVLRICQNQGIEVPNINEFEPEFPRNNLANLQSKVQALCEMLNNPKIHPKYAFSLSGLFDDAEKAYTVSEEYYRQHLTEQENELAQSLEQTRRMVKGEEDSEPDSESV